MDYPRCPPIPELSWSNSSLNLDLYLDPGPWWSQKSKLSSDTTSKHTTVGNPPASNVSHAVLSELPEQQLPNASRLLHFVGDDPWTPLARSRSDKNTWLEGTAEGDQCPGVLFATPPLLSASDSGYGTAVPPDLFCPTCGRHLRTKSEMRQVSDEFPAWTSYVLANRDRKHEFRHTMPYFCVFPGCPRKEGFSTMNDLQRHRQTVHGLDCKYRCDVGPCQHKFKLWGRSDIFRQHLKRAHGLDCAANSAELEKFRVNQATAVSQGAPVALVQLVTATLSGNRGAVGEELPHGLADRSGEAQRED